MPCLRILGGEGIFGSGRSSRSFQKNCKGHRCHPGEGWKGFCSRSCPWKCLEQGICARSLSLAAELGKPCQGTGTKVGNRVMPRSVLGEKNGLQVLIFTSSSALRGLLHSWARSKGIHLLWAWGKEEKTSGIAFGSSPRAATGVSQHSLCFLHRENVAASPETFLCHKHFPGKLGSLQRNGKGLFSLNQAIVGAMCSF